MFKYSHVFLIGIGGVGMSALALFFIKQGSKVFGYDREKSDITKDLEKKGAVLFYDFDLSQMNYFIDNDKNNILIIYTPAIDVNNILLKHFIDEDFIVKKRSEVLEEIIFDKKVIAVAGTHGKTTITSLVSHILSFSGINIMAFIGGFMKKEKLNFIFSEDPEYVVVEADEYDRSFLKIQPNIAIVSSIDMDHTDIYSSYDELVETFNIFLNKTSDLIISNKNLIDKLKVKNIKINTYDNTVSGTLNKETLEYLKFILPGEHNMSNVNAAVLTCLNLGLTVFEINRALLNFEGILRRFQFHSRDRFILIEDYAHHPKEIAETLKTVKSLYANEEITVFFQPHLFSRTSFFIKDFAESLSIADNVLLYDIYGAREKNKNNISSCDLLEMLDVNHKFMINDSDIDLLIHKLKPRVTIVLGAGDITKSIKKIYKSLKHNS